MTINYYLLFFIIGLAIIFFIVFFQYKRNKITIKKGIVAIVLYLILAIPLCFIQMNIHNALVKIAYTTALLIITTGVSWHSALKNKTATPKQLVKGMLIGFGIGILLLILLILGVVLYAVTTTN